MLTLIRNGGYVPMMFILLTGFAGLAAAFYFAFRANRRTLVFIDRMMIVTLFGTLAASCADVGATLYAAEKVLESPVPQNAPGPPTPSDNEAKNMGNAVHIVIGGLAESTSPGILGFSFLAVTALLVAVGRRRLAESE